jgi:hypothetical protein
MRMSDRFRRSSTKYGPSVLAGVRMHDGVAASASAVPPPGTEPRRENR